MHQSSMCVSSKQKDDHTAPYSNFGLIKYSTRSKARANRLSPVKQNWGLEKRTCYHVKKNIPVYS